MQICAAGFGEADATGRADEELGTQMLFERRDVT